MVPLSDQLCADPDRDDSPVDRPDGAPQVRWDGPRDALPDILAMPAEFMRALDELDAVRSTDAQLAEPAAPGRWSRLECIAHVAEVLHVTAKRLRLLFEQARTELTPTHNESVITGLHSASLPIIRAALVAAAADLADAVNEGAPNSWAHTAYEGDRVVSAETLLREALDDAYLHLHDLQQTVQPAIPPAHNE